MNLFLEMVPRHLDIVDTCFLRQCLKGCLPRLVLCFFKTSAYDKCGEFSQRALCMRYHCRAVCLFVKFYYSWGKVNISGLKNLCAKTTGMGTKTHTRDYSFFCLFFFCLLQHCDSG